MILAGALCLQVKETEHRLEEVPTGATRMEFRKHVFWARMKELGFPSLERSVRRVFMSGKKKDNIVGEHFGNRMNAGRHL